MKPLLKIQTIPIKIEAQTRRASLQHNPTPQPQVNITRTPGRANIQSRQARVFIDQTEARANSGLKTVSRLTRDFAGAGRSAALEATRNAAQEGNMLVDSLGKGEPLIDIAVSKATRPLNEAGAEYGQTQLAEFQVDPGSVSFDYQMDKLTFDWNVNTKPQLEYIPPSIEYSIKQYPQVIIEYVGEPIYVPASANPNYQGTA